MSTKQQRKTKRRKDAQKARGWKRPQRYGGSVSYSSGFDLGFTSDRLFKDIDVFLRMPSRRFEGW